MSLRILHAHRDIARYSQVLDVLGKHGFGLLIKEIHAHSKLPISKQLLKKKFPEHLEITGPARVRKVFEELGPTYIKLGQILSTRPDLVPPDYIAEFEKLQDRAPKVPFSQVREVLETELGDKIETVFSEFDRDPIASASIGQVHLARLKNNRRVAVKVQRPGIVSTVESDVDIMEDLARLAEKYVPEARVVEPVRIVREFEKTLRREMNYLSEGRNLDRMRSSAKRFKHIRIPEVFWAHTSARVLVMEYFDGDELNVWLKKRIPSTRRKKLGKHLANFFVTQILVDGFFQADPHAGNFVVLKNGDLGVIDLGMVGFIDDRMRENLLKFFFALMRNDNEGVAQTFLGIGSPADASLTDDFVYDVEYLMTQYNNISLSEVRLTELITELEYLIMRYHIRAPPNFTLFLKALTQVESILRKIYPQFNVIKEVRPIVETQMKEMARPDKVARRVGEQLLELNKSIANIPTKINEVLDQTKRGMLKIEFEHLGLSPTVQKFDSMTNRIVFALVISALVIASAIVMHLPAGPQLLGFSAFGLIGYLIAASLGFWLVIMMFTSGQI